MHLRNEFLEYVENRIKYGSNSQNNLGKQFFDFSQKSFEYEGVYFSLELLESALYEILSEENPHISPESIKYLNDWKLDSGILEVLEKNYLSIYNHAINLDFFRKKLIETTLGKH